MRVLLEGWYHLLHTGMKFESKPLFQEKTIKNVGIMMNL